MLPLHFSLRNSPLEWIGIINARLLLELLNVLTLAVWTCIVQASSEGKMDTTSERVGLHSIEEAAKVLGQISSWTLRKHVKRGSVKAVRIGRRVFLSAAEIRRIETEGLPSLKST